MPAMGGRKGVAILRLALRDLRGGFGGFWLLILHIALGTAAIAAAGLVSAAVLDGVRAGARSAVGGDVSLRLYHLPPPDDHLAFLAQAGTVSLTAELRPAAHHEGRRALVELKAADRAYPLYGDVRLDPPLPPGGSLNEALGQRDGFWGAAVAPELLMALDAVLGDTVLIGGQPFVLRALLRAEPDRALRGFSLGPRMIVPLAALTGTTLVAPGTRVRLGSNA